MARICKKCGGSLTIRQVVMSSNVCSQCATVSSFRPVVSSSRVTNSKSHIKLNFDAMVAAELKNQYQEVAP